MNAVYRTLLYVTVFGVIGKVAIASKPSTKPPTISTFPPTTASSTAMVTTENPTTTPEPPIEEGSWVVKDGNLTCIRAQLKLKFTVNIEDKKFDINLSPKANATGNCNASTTGQILALNYDNYVLVFEFEKNTTNTYVKNITFDLLTLEGTETFYNDTKLFTVASGNSYLCKSTDIISMGNVTMQILDIRLQAFGTEEEKDFGTAEECEADDSISDIVPIAVACALAALIVVVLIAYLVGRRRNRQRGYTSV